MQLRSVLAMVLGPWLATCKETGGSDLPATGKCMSTPMAPTSFFLKRKFASFLNIIEVKDRFGHDIGFVQTWLFNWKDPFGYPGATFYLKAHKKQPKSGVWDLHPTSGADGWDSNGGKMTREEHMLHAQQKLNTEEKKGFLENLKRKILSAYWYENDWYIASIEGKFGFFNSDVTITDCEGKKLFHAFRMTTPQRWYNKVFHKERVPKDDYGSIESYIAGDTVADGRYFTSTSTTANLMLIEDKSAPPIPLARVQMSETCNPFPPFCSNMGFSAWFWYGTDWHVRIVQPGYNETLASGFINIQQTAGTGTDMRFLTLFSAFQYSNTRWSPLMGLIGNILLLCCCLCLCWSCFATAPPPPPTPAPEETKLIDTEAPVPVESAPAGNGSTTSMFACCSRRGGRTVAIEPSA